MNLTERQGGLGQAMRFMPANADMRVEVATSLSALQALQPDYEQVLRSIGNTLPFALHEWHVAWCRHFLESSRRIPLWINKLLPVTRRSWD